MNNINRRVVGEQMQAGWDVGERWYQKYVTNMVESDADESVMYEAFMKAFNEHFPVGPNGKRIADNEALTLGAKPVEPR